MAKCPNCGANIRDTAKFCGVCGYRLSAVLPAPVHPYTPASTGVGVPAVQGAGQISAYPPQSVAPQGLPRGFPKVWSRAQPLVEGKVVHAEAPVQERGPIAAKTLAAGLLALVQPILAFLPFAHGAQMTVRYIRVEDWQTGQQRSVKIQGEPSGIISVGDWLAIWGKNQGGNIIMQYAFNYTTDAEIRLKR